jgi:hypothetical protein
MLVTKALGIGSTVSYSLSRFLPELDSHDSHRGAAEFKTGFHSIFIYMDPRTKMTLPNHHGLT